MESIVAGVGGPEFYKQTLIQATNKRFPVTPWSRRWTSSNASNLTPTKRAGRDWNLATTMVIKGEAAMQFMGDWARASSPPPARSRAKDYDALTVPGTADAFLFNVDSFIMFEVKDPEAKAAQKAMARLILSPDFQVAFNVNKGSIPVRSGISDAPFDAVAITAMKDFEATAKSGGLMPSMAHENGRFTGRSGGHVRRGDQLLQFRHVGGRCRAETGSRRQRSEDVNLREEMDWKEPGAPLLNPTGPSIDRPPIAPAMGG